METNQPQNKTSKVLKCDFKKTWNGKDGRTNYDYQIELENGDSAVYSSFGKEINLAGQEITYSIYENGNWGKKIRLVNNYQKTARPKNEKSISAQSAVKAAVELCCHNKIELKELEEWTEKIFAIQNKLGNIQ